MTVSDSGHTAIDITVVNKAIFNDTSYNNGTITGNVTFNNSAYNGCLGTISGNAIFNDSSHNRINPLPLFCFIDRNNVTGNATFNSISYNVGLVSGNAIFNNTSINGEGAIVTGNATFNDSSYNYHHGRPHRVDGIVSGNASFYDSTTNQSIVSGDACFASTADPDHGTVLGSISKCVLSSSGGGGHAAPQSSPVINTICPAGDKFSTSTGLPCTSFTEPVVPTQPVPSTSSCSITHTLMQGNTGDEVKCLQTKLNDNLVIDGIFGKLTKAAVIKFQLANKLIGDGIVGPLTRAALNK